MKNFRLIAIAVFTLGFVGVNGQNKSDAIALKDAFKDKFYIGVAINRNQANGTDKKAQPLISSQFNSISPENDMKWEKIHPGRSGYDFKHADAYVDFGVKNKMFVIGHTLVWHSQTPDWVFEDENGKPLTREALLKVMKDHITTVVSRYKGKIGGWDVVNEAFNEDGTYRQSKWYTIIGEDFIEKAFEYAHAADPNVELYYNDYNVYKASKRSGILKLVQKLKSANIKITAVGEQAHYGLNNPPINEVENVITDFAALNIITNFTELDVSVLPEKDNNLTADISNKEVYNAKYNPYTKGLPEEVLKDLAVRYADLFRIFVKYDKYVSRVTFWGLTDGDSWLNNFPMPGRTNYPLLYDRQYKEKQALFSAIKSTVK
ncbi:1,4-beta-xylanase [Flavobacterium sp. Sd200]|uniref:endo-1,4-beta-xylanase n=1 Tax=Flavobacterium sp. Sd200 TaxID=2692211 RepID=UPI001368D0F3|nr:endo-1,4-beta-xylanase [Flavobacterium sp. Sd200]MXN89728.1 1,4-beta-xylanase [Flavobacterium sp. Sd200]